MIPPRTEALLRLREAAGEESMLLEQLDRILMSRRIRSANKEAKTLRNVVEDYVLGMPFRGYDPETLISLQELLELYGDNEGAADPIRLRLDRGSHRLLFGPRVFISHQHTDVAVAEALIDLLKAAFTLSQPDLRCSSVRPYGIPVGQPVSDRIRRELQTVEAVMGLLAPDTSSSTWVSFELGAAWGNYRFTCPLLVHGARKSDIPDPLRNLHPLSLADPRDCHDLLDALEWRTTLRRKQYAGGHVSAKVSHLVAVASKVEGPRLF